MSKKFFVLSLSMVVGLVLALGSSFLVSLGGVSAQAQTAAGVEPITYPANRISQASPTSPTNRATQANPIDLIFLNEAAQSGLGYIALSELALRQSNNPEVTRFAQSEIQEQQQNAADFQQIAPSLGVNLPRSIPQKYQVAVARLSQLSGTEFDNAFLDEGGINSHLEAAALFQREAAFGQHPDLLRVANRGLNIINQHFNTARQLTGYEFAQVARRYGESAVETPSSNR